MKEFQNNLKMINNCTLCAVLTILLTPLMVLAGEYIVPEISTAAYLPISILLLSLIGLFLYIIVQDKTSIIKDSIAVTTCVLALIHSLFMVNYIFNPIVIQDRLYQGLFFSYRYMPNFDISLRIDKYSMVLLMLASIFWVAVSIFILNQNRTGDEKYKRYNLYILIALFLNFGILMAGDFLTLFMFYEAMTIFPYFALIHRKLDSIAHEEKRFLLLEVVTGIALLFGIILFYFFTNTVAMKDQILFFATQVPPFWSGLLFVLMVFGFGGKSSLFFQHIFPTKAKTNILLPVPGSFIFSIVMFQISAYAIFRYISVSLYKM